MKILGSEKSGWRSFVAERLLEEFVWRSLVDEVLLAKVLSKFVWVCGERSAKFSTIAFAT